MLFSSFYYKVLSKAPSVSRKVPSAVSQCSTASFLAVHCAVQFGKQTGFDVRDETSVYLIPDIPVLQFLYHLQCEI